MKAEHRFPAGAHRNADFITRSAKLKPGEKVINTQVDTETLGPYGYLCIAESTVRMMMAKLKITEADADMVAENKRLKAENAALTEKLETAQTAFALMKELAPQ